MPPKRQHLAGEDVNSVDRKYFRDVPGAMNDTAGANFLIIFCVPSSLAASCIALGRLDNVYLQILGAVQLMAEFPSVPDPLPNLDSE